MTKDRFPELLEAPPATDDAVRHREVSPASMSFPVVGVGASAGGLEAFTQLLRALPPDTGMAFVLVQHLAPTHASALAEILGRATSMPVSEVEDEPRVQPNRVYVIPPDRSMIIADGKLELLPRETNKAPHPVDQFFRSLAEECHHLAIGVILSGTATDGTLGVEAIKGEGGFTFAQDASAQHQGMPRSAIDSGCVDVVQTPEGIAAELTRIAHHPDTTEATLGDRVDIGPVVHLLRQSTGVDFTHYKYNTLYRRISRRMVFRKLDELSDYVNVLRETPAEVEALYRDVLISVTSFFRDPEAFEALKEHIFPRLIQGRPRNDPVRIWALGCSTGQEAYSLAIAFAEAADAAGGNVPLQLFATDLNALAIEKARTGVYSKDIAQDVSPDRLRRFFTEVDGHYRVAKSIRDACIFSRHDVLTDPPFSRIDVISCRNLLIYLEPLLQQRVLSNLHYALKSPGFLWLGGSETIGPHRDLFETEDSRSKIYVKKPSSGPGKSQFPIHPAASIRAPFLPNAARPADATADLPREADRLLSARYAPPGVVVSADLDILQYRGDTGPFLAPAPGKASLNLLKMLREGLIVAVRAAVLRAAQDGTVVREEGLRVKSDGSYHVAAVEVIPLRARGATDGGFLILFEAEVDPGGEIARTSIPARDDAARTPEPADSDVHRLSQELAATRDYLQSVIEQQEAVNEELQSANEEVQSANEELQSTNEELETSKEEIQSSNEELATVNDELNDRNAELNRVNNDLVNLLGSVQMPIVMLGSDLRVRRFTPAAEKVLNVIPTDVGRSLADINLNLDGVPDLESLLAEVIETVGVREREVRDKHGRWYSLRIHPYRTLENQIDGVVLMLVDMDAIKRAEEVTAHLGAIVTYSDDAIVSKDLDGIITSWNTGAEHLFGYGAEEAVGKSVTLLMHPDRMDEEAQILERIRRGEVIDHFETVRRRKDGRSVDVSLTISPLRDSAGRVIGAAKIARDITRHRMEAALRESEAFNRGVMDGTADCVDVLDLEGRVLAMNGPSGRRSDVDDPQSILGLRWSSTWPDSTRAEIEEALDRARRGEIRSIRASRPISTGMSGWWDVTVSPIRDAMNGPIVRLLAVSRDITEQFLAEVSIRESEERFRTLADNISQLVWIADEKGSIVWFNRRWFDYTGTTMDEMRGSGWKEALHPDHVERVTLRIQHSWDTGEVWEDTFPLRGKDGAYRWFLSRAVPIRNAEGKVARWFGSNTDITEQREMANQLSQYAADLAERDRRKTEFLAMLAHELRNPLAPIRNAVHILQLAKYDGESVEAVAAILERQLGQMVRLLDDLLDVNRITRGKIELKRGRVELGTVVDQAVEATCSLFEGRSHDIVVSMPPEKIYLDADPTRLAQIIGNLLNNACEFTDRDSQVLLDVERHGAEVVIRVRDSGIGITAEQLPRIFDLFMQVDTSLERSASGLGIGLTLVKSLVEMHGGTVEAYSAGPGCGSEFKVHLPVLAEPSSLPPEPTVDATTPVFPRRILVVDDNRDAADSLSQLLNLKGHHTQIAYDGLQGLDAVAAFEPDAVLLDIGLPKLNGYDAARAIRARPGGQDLTLVALTGWGQEEDRERSKAAGFDVHLVKPVDIPALLNVFDSLSRGTEPD